MPDGTVADFDVAENGFWISHLPFVYNTSGLLVEIVSQSHCAYSSEEVRYGRWMLGWCYSAAQYKLLRTFCSGGGWCEGATNDLCLFVRVVGAGGAGMSLRLVLSQETWGGLDAVFVALSSRAESDEG